MEVKLVACTNAPDDLCDIIAGQCYKDVGKDVKPSKGHIRLKKVIESGHTSVLEHATFTFEIKGISRLVLGELTRHRIGCSYTVQSTRYVRFDKGENVAPIFGAMADISEDDLNQVYEHIDNGVNLYSKLLEDGLSIDDARMILPLGLTTDLVLTMNARALYNFFNLRLCHRAYWEIQDLAWLMYNAVNKVAPIIFTPEYCMPNCVRDKCKESKPCGKPLPKRLVDIHMPYERL